MIRSNEEYNASLHPNCSSSPLPEIDFSKKVLLGFLLEAKGCSRPKYDFKVFRSDQNTVFNIEIEEQGMCKALFLKMIWITIDREFGERVSFENTNK